MGSSISFVCCVESGGLESQTVRMVESLRRFGGRLANAPLFAVTPRFGPPLQRSTRACFDRYDVRYLRRNVVPGRYGWFKFLNKPLAVSLADRHATTDLMCWLDSDLLILREPEGLVIEDVDFAASSSDKEMGTSGPGDAYEPLWGELATAAGVKLDDLPWVTTELDQQRIRTYWNGGLFSYRRASGMGQKYLETCERLLDARVLTKANGYAVGINEMSALGLAMVKMGLRYRALPFPYNYPLGTRTPPDWYSRERLAQVKILHYHDSMWAPFWPTLLERLRLDHPQVAAWLEPLGPMKNEAPLPARVLSRGLKYVRDRQEASYKQSCRVV